MTLTVELKTPVTGTYKQPTGLFINNEWVEAVDKKTFEVINPTTEEVICSVSEATEKDVDLAVKAARKAFETTWRDTTPQQRGILILKLADICEKNADLLAAVESLDNGKSITMARDDVNSVIGCIRYYGGWADKIEGKTIDIAPDMFHYTRQEPIGVCGQIIPWNFPLLMLAWKIGPALATGNVIIMKTAEQTPLSGLVFAELFRQVGFPAGVFNLLSGFGKVAGAAISSHMDVDKPSEQDSKSHSNVSSLQPGHRTTQQRAPNSVSKRKFPNERTSTVTALYTTSVPRFRRSSITDKDSSRSLQPLNKKSSGSWEKQTKFTRQGNHIRARLKQSSWQPSHPQVPKLRIRFPGAHSRNNRTSTVTTLCTNSLPRFRRGFVIEKVPFSNTTTSSAHRNS